MENKTKKLWFKRKTYGWGWTPCSLEGWLVILAYVILIMDIVKSATEIEISGDENMVWGIILKSVVLTIALIFICYKKGEAPKWSWGEEK